MKMQKEQIINYYEACESDYRLVWDLDHSHAMHAGYWDHQTKTLRDALRRENEVLAQKARIKKSDRVLDAGCGVGGSSFFIAQNYGCQVTGITLSHKQVEKAKKTASDAKIDPLPTFEVMDFTQTIYPDESFDVIWGLESICHADNKQAFIKEASRLLKRNGRLIVADGFARDKKMSIQDQNRMTRWINGWGVSTLETAPNFQNFLHEAGFKNILCEDITKNVLPSSKKLFWCSLPAIPLSICAQWLGFRTRTQTENFYGALCQYQTLKKDLWQYCIFYAEK